MINSGSYTDRLSHASYVLFTIKNYEKATHWFENMGFGQESLSDGFKIYLAAAEALSQTIQTRANRIGAVDDKNKMFTDVRHRHSVVVQMARMVIKDQPSRLRLGLKGRQPEAVDTWHGYAACFYQALLPQDLERLERVGITAERLQLVQDLLALSVAATAAVKAAAADAVEATVVLKTAFKALAEMMSEISLMARVGQGGNLHLAILLKLTSRPLAKRVDSDRAVFEGEDPDAKTTLWTWFDMSPKDASSLFTGENAPGFERKVPTYKLGDLVDCDDAPDPGD